MHDDIPLLPRKDSGLSLLFATLCVVDIFGVFPIIALPRAIVQCGETQYEKRVVIPGVVERNNYSLTRFYRYFRDSFVMPVKRNFLLFCQWISLILLYLKYRMIAKQKSKFYHYLFRLAWNTLSVRSFWFSNLHRIAAGQIMEHRDRHRSVDFSKKSVRRNWTINWNFSILIFFYKQLRNFVLSYPLVAVTELTLGRRASKWVAILLNLTVFAGGIPNLLVGGYMYSIIFFL